MRATNERPAEVGLTREVSLDEVEHEYVRAVLAQVSGNKTEAAKRLGVTARTLLNKMKSYQEHKAA